MKCPVCETIILRVCPDCKGPICLICQQRYEAKANPLICWVCQNGVDLAWVDNGFKSVRRTWPLVRMGGAQPHAI